MTPLLPAVFGIGIANAAHVGGLFCGMITGPSIWDSSAFKRESPENEICGSL
jgi:membrane associated rhomboid family serine protease